MTAEEVGVRQPHLGMVQPPAERVSGYVRGSAVELRSARCGEWLTISQGIADLEAWR